MNTFFWTFRKTLWTGDQPPTRLLPTQDSATHKNADTHPASSGIRTHDPSVRTVETLRTLDCAAIGNG